MEINHKKLKYISGPISVIKLNGKINNNEKNIILFGDIHINPNSQTECKDPNSVTIKQYLNNIFTNTNQKLDFFLEISNLPDRHFRKGLLYTGNYLEQLAHYFLNNKDEYKNVRFHNSDIRNDINLFNFIYIHSKEINNFLGNTLFYVDEIDYIIEYIEEVKDYLNIVVHGLKKSSLQFKRIMNNIDSDSELKYHFSKDIYKILFKIKNKDIEKKIKSIIKHLLKNLITDLNSFKKECILIKKNLDSNLKYSLKQEIEVGSKFKLKFLDLNTKLQTFFTTINDMYILRRILDKDYSKNIIVYTGHLHTVNLLNILLNYFNFKIIDKYVSKNIKHNIYLDKNYVKNIYKYYSKILQNMKHDKNEVIYQCIDISKFKKPLNEF